MKGLRSTVTDTEPMERTTGWEAPSSSLECGGVSVGNEVCTAVQRRIDGNKEAKGFPRSNNFILFFEGFEGPGTRLGNTKAPGQLSSS